MMRRYINFSLLLSTFLRFLKNFELNKKTILVFRHDELGDVTLWLDAAEKLRSLYPSSQYRIILMAKPALRPFLESCPYWDEIMDFDLSRFSRSLFYRIICLFRILGADIIINPVINRNIGLDRMIGYSGTKQRIGIDVSFKHIFRSTEAERQEGNTYYTQLINLKLSQHISQINIDFINALSSNKDKPKISNLTFIKTSAPPVSEKYFLVVPGAGHSGRRWETDKYADVINYILSNKHNLTAIICGTASESIIAEKIITQVKSPQRIKNLCGKTSLKELINLVQNSLLIIGNDTGTIHLAPCLKVPSICILGGGHFGIFHPYPPELTDGVPTIAVFQPRECFNCTWACYQVADPEHPYPCISAVTPEMVIGHALKILSKEN